MIRPKKNRAVITGLGILAANGTGKDEFWRTLLAGESGVGPITLFDASDLPSRIAGEVKNFDHHDFIPPRLKAKRLARATQLALAATMMATKDAGIHLGDGSIGSKQYPIPVVVGVSYSALDIIDKQIDIMKSKSPKHVARHVVCTSTPQAIAGAISQLISVPTQVITLSTACAAGLDAIGTAVRLVRDGQADIAIAIGADSPISPFGFASFASAGLSSLQNDDPPKACRPFDRDRSTGVIGEGAGAVIVENLDHALARGATPYLEITGFASASDAPHDDQLSGLAQTMILALSNAKRYTRDIDFICAHAPGHPLLDRIETKLIKNIFGNRAYRIPVTSIKGATANPLAAAGAMQVIACALIIRDQQIPPVANLENPDIDCDLDFVRTAPRHANIDCALINTHGVGGTNSSMIVERVGNTV